MLNIYYTVDENLLIYCIIECHYYAYYCLKYQLGSSKYGDTLRVLAGGGSAANQVEYTSKYGSALPVLHSVQQPDDGSATAVDPAPLVQQEHSTKDDNATGASGAGYPSVDDIASNQFD